MDPTSVKLGFETHQAEIVSRFGEEAKYNESGFCPHHPGLCRLRKRNALGFWVELLPYCPFCFEDWKAKMNASAPTVSSLPPVQQAPLFDTNYVYQPSHPDVEALKTASSSAASVKTLQNVSVAALEDEASRTIIAQAGGIAAILTAMNTHTAVATVQEQACGALWNLAINDDNRVAIARANGIAAIIAAMNAHTAVATVQEKACEALRMLARNPENKAEIVRLGGASYISA